MPRRWGRLSVRVATTLCEKDFVPVANRLLEGNRSGAVEKCAELLLGVITGHPIVGALGARLTKDLCQALASGYVDSATARMLKAEREWEDAEAKSAWLRQQMAASVAPLLSEQSDADDERFLQTLRYIERNVASAAAVDEILAELRSLTKRMGVDTPPDIATPKELREWMVAAFSPEELEVFVSDALPNSGGLRCIVSSTHAHEYQVFKVVEYCQRRGQLEHLRLRLKATLGSPAVTVSMKP